MSTPAHTANNFNLLRLVFAVFVVVYHLVVLSAAPAWSGLEGSLSELAETAVQGFFVLSGFLAYASLDRSATVRLYAEKRVRRLYPAYAAVIIVSVGASVALVPEARANLGAVGAYLGWNLVFANFMAPEIPGIFSANSLQEINGALWTLKIEVMFYLVLPLLAWVLRISGPARWPIVTAIYVAAEAWRLLLANEGEFELARQLPGQMSFFITGMMLYRLSLRGTRLHIAGCCGAFLLAASLLVEASEPVRALGLGLVCAWIAVGWPRLPDAARFGDISYGLYITHFPIIQVVVAAGLFGSPWIGAGISLVATVTAAAILWRVVERPSLRRDSAYRNSVILPPPPENGQRAPE
jgi:peptidoglycan/LPS O-acetylase OafA/YrhL